MVRARFGRVRAPPGQVGRPATTGLFGTRWWLGHHDAAGRHATFAAAAPPEHAVRAHAGPWDGDAPRLRPGIVARPRLLRRLLAADAPIVMIVAPAGYGKTTLLAEWAMRDPRPFAWLSVEALRRAGDGAVASLAGLVEDVGACLTPHVIVLDDTHHLASDLSMRRVTDLACRLPAGSCVAVASRRRLAVPLARLRGHRLLVEFAARELAMTRLEAAMLLDTAGVRLEAGQLDRLVALTEGWPVGLYLAALSIREQDGSQEAITQLGGGDRLVADYIRDEVLRDLAEHELAFLRRTSILRRISAPLCDAVLEAARRRRGARPPHARRHPDRAGRSLRLAVSVQPALGGDAPRRPHPR